MPNSIKYKTGNLSGSLQKGNVALGLEVTGPSSTTGWYNGITPNPNQYIIYKVDSLNSPIIYAPSNQDELVRVAIQEGATNINTGSSTASILNYFAGQSNLMAVNIGYPSIVTDGLILLNDSSFTPSYPTTASTWYDVSGNNKNGSLINGPLFDSNRGVINFDGINETVNYGTGNTFFPLPSFSIELTFQSKGTVPTTGTAPGLFGFTYGIRALFTSANNIQFGVSSGSSASNQSLNYTHTSNFRDDGKWYNIIFQATPTNSYIYLNGELKASRSVVWLGSTVWPTNGWNLARDNNNVNYFFTGSISNFKMYNKALTQAEILQNYYQAPIVTDGLVFAVDASNLVSYESGSTTTYSLTGSLSGSLINGTGYSSGNGGNWVFDGVDDYINIPINSAFNTPSVTFEVWANLQTINDRHILYVNWAGNSLEVNSDRSVTMYNWSSGGQLGAGTNAGVFNWDTWTHFVGTYDDASQTLKTYVNGVLLGTRTSTPSTIYSVYAHKISGTDFGGEVKGKISTVRHYSKALSLSEIQQNYNAQRSRFGI